MTIINTIIGTPLGWLMWLCFSIIKNYGIAVILFTLLTKIILFPLNCWAQKNSIKMVKIQPMINEIAAKYAGNRDKIAEEQLALYKQEHYKPLAGLIPLLIQIPIILGLISVIYNPLQHLLHMDQNIINAFISKGTEILYIPDLGPSAQLKIVELINNPSYTAAFSSLQITGAKNAVAQIQALDLNFLGLDLSSVPNLAVFNGLLLFPVFSALSSFLLSWCQNKINVLQREQGWLGRWGTAMFLTLFSLYFALIVPTGVGLYWITGNLFSVLITFLVNKIYDPKKYIDYEALEKSKIALEKSKAIAKKLKLSDKDKAKAKSDYKRFCSLDNKKKLVFYSEKSGYYKYYENVIDEILAKSDIVIHYVTSDPHDAIFEKNNPRIIPYFIDDNRLIVLFMKMDADIVVMTMPDLQQMYLKRSYIRKDTEYIYMFHYPLSTTMVLRKGALDYYDTIFCIGRFQFDEIRQTERHYALPEKNLIECGYGLLEKLQEKYDAMVKTARERKKILIAPSWQDDNILDSCINDILQELLGKGFQVVVRPHPEYVKRYGTKMSAIVDRYNEYSGNDLNFELDFSKSDSLFDSDMVISDWSGTAYEFAFVTKKPVIFINTPPKINNPEYDVIEAKPLEITLRDQIGIQVETGEIKGLASKVRELFYSAGEYEQKITQIRQTYISNFGCSGQVGAQYIIERLAKKKQWM